jgi:hypothetical protein
MKAKIKLIGAVIALVAIANVSAGTLTMSTPEPTGLESDIHIATFSQAGVYVDNVNSPARSFNQVVSFNLSNPLAVTASFSLGGGWDSFFANYGGTNYNIGSGTTFSLAPTVALTSYSITLTGTRSLWSNGGLGIEFNGTKLAVAPVPEPETYAMLLAGLGLIGAIARRRKVAVAAA